MVPTIERRLTPIKDVYLENVKATNVKFISKISGQKELPVENIFLKDVAADVVKENQNIHINVLNFVNKN
ncbi:hypothetical protein D3C87_2085760 [compost metagenome]